MKPDRTWTAAWWGSIMVEPQTCDPVPHAVTIRRATNSQRRGDLESTIRIVMTSSNATVTALRAASSHGSLSAALILGRLYEEGWGVRNDDRAAFRWYKKAAAGGMTSLATNAAAARPERPLDGERFADREA